MLGVRKFNETFAHTLRSKSHGAIHQYLQRLLRALFDTHPHAVHLGKQRRVQHLRRRPTGKQPALAQHRDLVREHNLIAVVVLHDINLAARFADHIAVLRQGRLYASGAADDVLNPLLFAEVYRVRARIERCSQQTVQVLVDGAF